LDSCGGRARDGERGWVRGSAGGGDRRGRVEGCTLEGWGGGVGNLLVRQSERLVGEIGVVACVGMVGGRVVAVVVRSILLMLHRSTSRGLALQMSSRFPCGMQEGTFRTVSAIP
jgi:hypothetical protein